MKSIFFSLLTFLFFCNANAQYWQQHVEYSMEVTLEHETAQYSGNQKLVYTNNSPETLHKVFYHLYFNAFKPGSEMAVRLKNAGDKNRRFSVDLDTLSPAQQGFLKVSGLTQDGMAVKTVDAETILEVTLKTPLGPGQSTVLELSFNGQVHDVIRRAGKNSSEGIAFSMAQWYPKLAEYDLEGWNTDPYTGREFHGVWGDFDVKITIDKSYTLGGTGYLQNPNQIGHGYQDEGVKVSEPKGKTLTWHFVAPKVHDFMWAADNKYKHDKVQMPNGITVHHFYIPGEKTTENWEKLKEYTPKAIDYLSQKFGQYPYKQFSVVQGGDGGMEYAMSTLISGERTLPSLVGVMVHELAHSWFHGVLASNESLYPWMDEGFTSYASNLAMASIFQPNPSPQRSSYGGYYRLVKSGLEEPMSTHSDHYQTNSAYGAAAYSKGAVFLAQFGYVIGEDARDRGMLRYWNTWKFKHPNVNDLIRVMEKESGLELDWYKEYFVNSTKTIDYSVKEVKASEEGTSITLERVGAMPMPVDLVVTYKDGTKELVYLPLEMMRGEKKAEANAPSIVLSQDWPWTHPTYTFSLKRALDTIKSVEIDPSKRMADVQLENNKVEF